MTRKKHTIETNDIIKKMVIFFVLVIILFLLSAVIFSLLTKESIKDSLFRTLQTLAFVFDDDSSTAEKLLEIFLAIFGVFVIWWTLWNVADMVIDGSLTKHLKRHFYSIKINKMMNHVIIVGGGRVGEEIAKVLESNDTQFLIIDSDPKTVSYLRNKKYTVIEGDALDESLLKTAGILTASKIMLTLPKTESNIMLTINSKELNPQIIVHSRCEDSAFSSKLKKVGADFVVVPETLAGKEMANNI